MTSSHPPRPVAVPAAGRRLARDERREQILACASRLFGERPYGQVSTTEIAREAGIARGLLNHYFGDKRGLYLEVVRAAVLLPVLEQPDLPAPVGTLAERVSAGVDWFLDSVEPHGATYLTVVAGEGVGEDPEVAAILEEADDLAARRVLQVVDLDAEDPVSRAAMRAYGGLAKAVVREWKRRRALTRGQAHAILAEALLGIIERALASER